MAQLPTVPRGDYDSVHYHLADEDERIEFEIEYWHKVAEYLEPVIGKDYSGAGGFEDYDENGVWYEATYDNLRIRVHLLWS